MVATQVDSLPNPGDLKVAVREMPGQTWWSSPANLTSPRWRLCAKHWWCWTWTVGSIWKWTSVA